MLFKETELKDAHVIEIKELRESKSRPQDGIVTFIHRAWNQNDELVADCTRIALMLKKPAE